MIQNIQTIFNFSKKKFKIFGNAAAAAFPNIVLIILLHLSLEDILKI